MGWVKGLDEYNPFNLLSNDSGVPGFKLFFDSDNAHLPHWFWKSLISSIVSIDFRFLESSNVIVPPQNYYISKKL